jgi:hypothetical protein
VVKDITGEFVLGFVFLVCFALACAAVVLAPTGARSERR